MQHVIRINELSTCYIELGVVSVPPMDGDDVVLKLFLEAGMDVNAKNNDGRTALLGASLKGHAEVVRLLKEAGTYSVQISTTTKVITDLSQFERVEIAGVT